MAISHGYVNTPEGDEFLGCCFLPGRQDADTVNFQCEGSDDRIADFDLKLMTKLGNSGWHTYIYIYI